LLLLNSIKIFHLVKIPEIHVQLVTPLHEVKLGRQVEVHCYIDGFLFNKASWSFQSGLLPINAHVTDDGRLIISNFNRTNLGTYTCSILYEKKRLTQSIDFMPNDLLKNVKTTASYQIYSSRKDYYLGGRLLIECISSGRKIDP